MNWTDIENELVEMIQGDSVHMTDDMKKTVERTIKMLDDEVLAKIKSSTQNDKKTLKGIKDKFDNCASTRRSANEDIKGKEKKFKDTHKELVACRKGDDGEGERNEVQTECHKVEEGLKEKKGQECAEAAAEINEYEKMVKLCKQQGKNGYVTFITWNEDAFRLQNDKHDKELKECNDATKAHDDKVHECVQASWAFVQKKGTCENEQKALEINSCFRLTDTVDMNEAYRNCYNPVLTEYQRTILILKKAESERNEQWQALARIKCFLDVFTMTNNKQRTDQIDMCRKKDFSTTKWNLIYWPAPPKEKAREIKPFACNSEFEALYYKNSFDPTWAPSSPCKWCAGHKPTPPPTPEPTPRPTPLPTPPPTPKPTPVPTLAEGEGCKIKLYKKENYKGGKMTVRYGKKTQKYLKKLINADGIKSWKAEGDQCKFCFYTKTNFLGELLGQRVPHPVVKGKRTGQPKEIHITRAQSVKIIDHRSLERCPIPGEEAEKDKKEKIED